LHCSALEVLEKKIPSKETLAQRMKDCTTLLEDGKIICLTGEESEKVIDFFKEEIGNVQELKGTIACKGIVKGKVKVIHTKEDFGKMEEGNVLIASMTTPEMVPIMKKAAAFVTDEGGVTCHAAIISREMKKPCIIGTKNATQAFKDGDLVEVDAESGIVKILEEKE
jgi:pyruvate,water dikinase